MAKIRKILLFGPAGNSSSNTYLYFYLNFLYSLAEAFESHGVHAEVCLRALEGKDLEALVNQIGPDCVLDINRSRNQIPGLDTDVFHIAWVQDPRDIEGRMVCDGFGGSEIAYFFLPPTYFGFSPDDPANETFRFLHPGVDERVLRPGSSEPVSDFCFVGFLPDRISEEMRRLAVSVAGAEIAFGEIVDAVEASDLTLSRSDLHDVKDFVVAFLRRRLGNREIDLDSNSPLVRSVDDGVIRTMERRTYLDGLLGVSGSMRIFGPENWTTWPRYRPYYGGLITDRKGLAEVYRTTRLGFHNGRLNMHFRVLEAMACGLPMLIVPTPFDQEPGGIRQYFEPGRHYIEVGPDTVAAVARDALADCERRREIGEQASKAVLGAHTWGHRVEQILADIAET